jgi:biotin transport system substrate-specific component
MHDAAATRKRYGIGYAVFQWRTSLSILQKLALVTGMACVTGLMAQVRIPLPWTPVPITGQTLAVLLCGVILGRWWGGLSQALYVGLGALGMPWFSGWSGGYAAIAGPTGGYLIGFVLAALFVGYCADSFITRRRLISLVGLMLFANFVLIHVPGLLHLRLWYSLAAGTPITFRQLLLVGVVPFIAGDIVKVVAAAGIATAVAPRR